MKRLTLTRATMLGNNPLKSPAWKSEAASSFFGGSQVAPKALKGRRILWDKQFGGFSMAINSSSSIDITLDNSWPRI